MPPPTLFFLSVPGTTTSRRAAGVDVDGDLDMDVPGGRGPVRSRARLAAVVLAATALAGCAVKLPDRLATTQPAVITLIDTAGQDGGVQLIVLAIDGAAPPKAGPYIDPSVGGPADRTYPAGTVISRPQLRPARWNFAVDAGTRELSLVFAVPGKDLLNLLAVTRARGSDATGLRITVQPGCEYQIAATLTVVGGRDPRPEVRNVRPIPSQFGLPAATSCPAARDVPVTLVRGTG